jgi:hypothetical protein
VVLKLIAVSLVWNFPVGPAEQARLRAEIDARLEDENGRDAH